MIRKLLGVAVTLALPTLLAAQTPQIPNDHASDTAVAKVTRHRQNPQMGPVDEASDVAKAKVAEHRATRRQGEAVGLDNRPTWIAQPPVGRATPPAAPSTVAVPHAAMPAQPPQKPTNPGSQAGTHRP